MAGRNRGRQPRSAVSRAAPRERGRLGMTLVELLLVVSILILLTALAVPRIKPALRDSRVREASRQLNAFLALSKARAIDLGRPAGIWLERSEPGSNAVLDVFQAEMPQPYSGDALNATVSFTLDMTNFPLPGRYVALGVQPAPADPSLGFINSDTMTANPANQTPLIARGEKFWIKFDYKGTVFECTRDPTNINSNFFVLAAGAVPPAAANGTLGGTGVPYQAFRAPERSLGKTLQFSGGAIVDLEYSGIGIDGTQFAAAGPNDSTPVVIMFFPGGSVERVVHHGTAGSPIGTIHLMVGELNALEAKPNAPAQNSLRTERADDTANAPNNIRSSATDATVITYSKNVSNRSNVWLAIGHRNGAITTAPNGWELLPPPPWPGSGPPKPYFVNSLAAGREFAHSGQTMGGR